MEPQNQSTHPDPVCRQKLSIALTQFSAEKVSDQLLPLCRPVCFAAGEHLLEAGETAESVFFLCAGLVRFYYLTEDGREHNKSFAGEGQFTGAMQLSHHPQPSRFSIQALEPVSGLAIGLDSLNRLYTQSLTWANIGRLYMESLAVRKAQREAEFLLDSAEQRYRNFLEQYPGLMDRLPLYHVASYLGITDVALSRIRRRIRESGI